jgi:peptidoglycan/LPS O-acetylase OafA/YrhL
LYYFLRFSDTAYLHTALKWALGLPNFVPTALRFNASYWSLIIEVHFYAVLPILFFLTRGLRQHHTAALLFFLLLVVPLATRQLTWPDRPLSKDALAFLMGRFPCQLDFFAWGVLFAGVFTSLSAVRDQVRALSLFGYAGVVLLMATLGFWAFWSHLFDIHSHPARWSVEVFHFLPSIAAFLMLFFVFDPHCLGSRLLGHPWLRFIGIVSYEWFLFHQPVVYFFQDVLGQGRGSLLWYGIKTVLPLALTFGLSVLIYRYFSLPLLNRIRGNTLNNQRKVEGPR